MKFKVFMKTPDCLHYALGDCDEDDKVHIETLCERWFQYGENVTLEVDTAEATCKVLGVKK